MGFGNECCGCSNSEAFTRGRSSVPTYEEMYRKEMPGDARFDQLKKNQRDPKNSQSYKPIMK